MENTFSWIAFHEELANKLLEYKDRRSELFNIIKDLAEGNEVLNYLNSESVELFIDKEINPLSIYSIFNREMISEDRTDIMKLIANAFDIKASVPSDFTGIPLINNQDESFNDNNEMWLLFESAIKYADDNEFTEGFEATFENIVNIKGKSLATITMGLFWIRPNIFLNLDTQNREFLSNIENGLAEVIEKSPKLSRGDNLTGKEYVEMIQELKLLLNTGEFEFKTISEMSSNVWSYKEESKDDNKVKKTSRAAYIQWFAPLIQALKDLGGTGKPKEVIDKIAENEKLSEEILNKVRGKRNLKKFDNEVNWARNDLAYAGIIDKSVRGIWSLTDKGEKIIMTDEIATEIVRKYRLEQRNSKVNVIPKKRYWIYSIGSDGSKWDTFCNDSILSIGWDELDDFEEYSSKEDISLEMQRQYDESNLYVKESHAIWQFANEMQVGDIIYSKKGLHEVLGRGIVESDYIYDENKDIYKHIRKINWTHKGSFESKNELTQKRLTDLTQYTEYIKELEGLFLNEEESETQKVVIYPKYTKEDFLSQVYITDKDYEILTNTLRRKKNIILKGAPGVGKTFAAKRLAYSIMKEMDSDRVEMVQFHQSYAYEDFLMGYRPDNNGFKLVYGAFYNFCKKAQEDNERDYFFIIDEINRGNLSKIFGELFMLIESDKRDESNSIRLLYVDEQFYIPSNVHIIGMMNTADRSLAMLDYALHRRFSHFEVNPAFDSDGFKKYQKGIANYKFDKLIKVIKQLNEEIKEDVTLGSGFRVGHSYFIEDNNDVIDDIWLKTVVDYEVIPLLQEYWFDEHSKVEEWTQKLKEAIV